MTNQMQPTDYDIVYCAAHGEYYVYHKGNYVHAFNTRTSAEFYICETEEEEAAL
jgi:hypothetical protein